MERLFVFCQCMLVLFAAEVRGVSYSGPGINHKIKFDQLSRYVRQAENITEVDNHIYYDSVFYSSNLPKSRELWFDLSGLNDVEVIPERDISDRFRVYMAHPLPFDFLFYGHTINTIAVTTGGFLYTSDFLHSNVHLTQYIAPLQADFNPSLNDSARVIVYSSDERFTVQWDKVHANDHVENGTFTFQVSLFRNGTIHFVYRDIPLLISDISTEDHPVEVGLSDSFYLDRLFPPNIIRRHIFEYSRIRLSQQNLNYSAYVLTPVPSCVPATSCESCVAASSSTPFECGWCSRLNRCSDGYDRFRQDWVEAGCSESASISSCPLSASLIAVIAAGTLLVSLVLMVLVGLCVVILVYGYRNPNSRIGNFMIEHRPKARSLNKVSASYDFETGKATIDDKK